MSNARDPADKKVKDHAAASGKLVRIKIADYDPTAKVPVVFGDADGDVLIAEGDLVLLAGEVGAGKSVTLADMALAAAFAKPLLEFPCPKARKMMLVLADGDGEMPSRRRVYRLGEGRSLTAKQIDDCPEFKMYVPSGFSLDDPADFLELQAAISAYKPDLIGIESIASLMGPDRDPYNQKDMADFMGKRIRPLQKRDDGTRRTVLVGAHLTKQRSGRGNGIKDRVATSFYTLGAADAAIGLDAIADEKFIVEVVKRSRWGSSFAPFLVVVKGQRNEPLTLCRAVTFDGSGRKEARTSPELTKAKEAIEAARKTTPDLTRRAAIKVCVAAKVKRSTAYRACDAMGLA